MKRILSFVLVMLMFVSLLNVQSFADDNEISWDYDNSTNTLFIKGEGPMEDFSDIYEAPWAGKSMLCEKVVVQDGVETIGDYAFAGFVFLETVTMSDSVKSLGDNSFGICMSLKSVRFSNNLEEVGDSAFSMCDALAMVDLPSSLRRIDDFAFSNNSSLEYVILPDGLEKLSSYAFSMCENLKVIYIPSSIKSIDSAELFNTESVEVFLYGGSEKEFESLLESVKNGIWGEGSVACDVTYYDAVEMLATCSSGKSGDLDLYVYTRADSPIEVAKPVGDDYFVLLFNKGLEMKDYYEYMPTFENLQTQSGEFGFWRLPAVLADCISFYMGTMVTVANIADEGRNWRVMAGFPAEDTLLWRAGDQYNIKNMESFECCWQGEELQLAAVMMAPLNDSRTNPDFYCSGGYSTSFSPDSFILVTTRLEAARNYMRALGLEDYLVI